MNLIRLTALTAKESKQLLRDPYSIILGILLPIILLLICGFGMSTDLRNIRLVLVIPETSEEASNLAARFDASEYFDLLIVRETSAAEEAIRRHRADVALYLPDHFSRRIAAGDLQLLTAVNASNPSLAYTKESYVRGILASVAAEWGQGGSESGGTAPSFSLKTRLWFNDANESSWTLIPGMIVIIMMMIGALLTSMVMAREYEQGNLESLFVTPTKSSEILAAKMINNFLLGMLGLTVSLLTAHFVFRVPIRADWFVIPLGSSVFLILALATGLFISTLTKNQFLAVEMAAVTTFLPSFLLSGFIFEIRSMPVPLQWITVFVPARYYVDFLQTAFLVGTVWPNILKNVGILALFACVFLVLAWTKSPKRLEG